MRQRLQPFSLALVAGLLGALVLAGAPQAIAKPSERQETSLRSTLDDFASAVKAESERAMAAASKAADKAVEASKGTFAEVKAGINARIESLRKTLSEQKAGFAIIGDDAAARLDAWRQAAAESLAEAWPVIHRSAADALDWFQAWIRQHSASEEQAGGYWIPA